jgi:hypothetical protein
MNDHIRKVSFIFAGLFLLFSPFAGSALFAQSMKGLVDTLPPSVETNYPSGKYKSLLSVKFTASEPATIFYTLDNTQPSDKSMEYRGLLSIADEGRTVLRYVAYDMVGNRSREYENIYFIDTHVPTVDIMPPGGVFGNSVDVKILVNEPGRVMYSINNAPAVNYKDSLRIAKSCTLRVFAEDETGNKSEVRQAVFSIDLNVPNVTASHESGIFDKSFSLSLSAGPGIRIYYSFDEFAPLTSYQAYTGSIPIKNGQAVFSFYGENKLGTRSDVIKKFYTIDYYPPKVTALVKDEMGRRVVLVRANEKADMTYTTDGSTPTSRSPALTQPIPIPKKGLLTLRVWARDQAGNVSDDFQQKFSFDISPPVVTVDPPPGLYTRPLRIILISNKPGKIFYTLDNTLPDKNSSVYTAPLAITRDSRVTLTSYAVDELGTPSDYASVVYSLDQTPPKVIPKIERGKDSQVFTISFDMDVGDAVYYVIGAGVPTILSAKYAAPFEVKAGNLVKYIAVDSAGNKTEVQEMNELALPKVTATPPGGTFKKVLRIALSSNMPGKIFYRLRTKTVDRGDFQEYTEPLLFNINGLYKIEYYSEDNSGARSSITEETYLLDLYPPEISVYTQRNAVDSTVTIHFQASENVSIYFTLDGTNPYTSPTASVIGNKYFLSKDKIKLKQTQNLKINFIGEDAAGNRSEMYMFDVNLPTVIASPPEGRYNEVLHVSLSTFNDATIFYTTDGLDPTEHSAVYRVPVSITRTMTLKYFAVDQYGYKGLVKGGDYVIDLPPRPDFAIDNDPIIEGAALTFDASSSVDEESPAGSLQFRWDFENDGNWDTDYGKDPKALMTFKAPGIKTVTLQVKDTAGLTSLLTRQVRVIKDCPRDMLPLFDNGRAYCMDRFEFPNVRDSLPLTGVTWVEAVMRCRGVGKELCGLSEWRAACRGREDLEYPYGLNYDKRKCNTQGSGVAPSGDRRDCVSSEGVYDLTGNAWEWVEDRQEGYNLIAGGDYGYGKNASCDATFYNLISSREKSVGFRCCK